MPTDWSFQYFALLIALLGSLVSLINIRSSKQEAHGKERPHFSYAEVLIIIGDGPARAFMSEFGERTLENYTDGGPVILRLLHKGPEARDLKVSTLSATVYELGFHHTSGDHHIVDIHYILNKAIVGKPEKFKITYATASDRIESQIWEYCHGSRSAKRVKVVI